MFPDINLKSSKNICNDKDLGFGLRRVKNVKSLPSLKLSEMLY